MPPEAFSEQEGSSFVDWLLRRVIVDGRGDEYRRLPVRPEGRFWLGRLTPEAIVQTSRLGQRAERLDPCEVGIRIRPSAVDGRRITCRASFSLWIQEEPEQIGGPREWRKRGPVEVEVAMATPAEIGQVAAAGRAEIDAVLNRLGAQGYAAEVHAELEDGKDGPELIITLVNVSPGADPDAEQTIYEASLIVQCGETQPFTLDDLPDSFRFDRHVPAYGINCGVDVTGPGTFATNDIVRAERRRPEYWDVETLGVVPDLTFDTLAHDPLPSLRAVSAGMRTWGERYWSDAELEERRVSEHWSAEMLAEAHRVRDEFRQEHQRLDRGIVFLDANANALRAFKLMNRAFSRAVSYPAWRPFQLGFVLAVLPCIEPASPHADLDVVDTLWFATGGGKTETYIGLVATAAFYDRLRGKRRGVTSWARFPLRMLSLQQTQRFANIFASAELVRRDERLEGDPFSVGFLVGSGPSGTPNNMPSDPRPGEPDYRDAEMVAGWKILSSCPFCHGNAIEMRFDTARWTLNHHCTNDDCTWDGPLPFRIVDEEVFRYLPTIVIGTLDKAALISLKAAMRGLYGPPLGQCSTPGHGFTYAKRSKAPEGCEVPNCRGRSGPLQQAPELFAPSIRIQDELHLLRDSLGAIDAHYEALLDHLQAQTGPAAKIIASSATIAGHEHQVDVLYRRRGRLFPASGPWSHRSFWSQDGDRLTRAYVGLAPRGITLDYATDRANEALQSAVRRALAEPDAVAREAGVRREALPTLVNIYGVGVVYGSTLKDVEAAARSFDSQISFNVNSVMLIGRTPLNDVRSALQRLVEPEAEFEQRIHLVAASSMLSHGVDIDRLNTMVMLGLPLSTAEFIQTTARIGRKHPGLVLVMHKIGRERDAKVFRSFRQFVEHAERLVDPVPITRRSRRVLELTFPGLMQGRLYGVHEPRALAAGLGPLTLPASLRKAFQRLPVIEEDELQELIRMLGADRSQLDEGIRQELTELVRGFYRSMNDPGTSAKWISDLFRTPPMRSLRDVEDQVPVETEGMRR